MTAHKYVTIWCDYGYDPQSGRRPCSERFDEPMEVTAAAARNAAARAGWKYFPSSRIPGGGDPVDMCPMHARDRRRGKP